jgi:UDP-N-acetylmuramate dehydrogenase
MHCWNDFETIRRPDAPLSGLTWYKLGGPARALFEPRDEHELASLIRRCNDAGARWRVLGGGANLLVRDGGLDDVVIRLSEPAFRSVIAPGSSSGGVRVATRSRPFLAGHLAAGSGAASGDLTVAAGPRTGRPAGPAPRFSWIESETAAELARGDFTIHVGAGVDMLELVKRAAVEGWEGFEALAGIPGTVGGCIRMNAGGRFGSIAPLVRDVTLVTPAGQVATRDADELGFSYRRADLGGGIVVSARLHARPADAAETHRRYLEIWRDKYRTQPPLKARSSGCIFKNPRDVSAGRLIDDAGLKGVRRGGAEISPIHANFIVAHDGARADDVLGLIDQIREKVLARSGIDLELEVEVW